MSFNSYNITNEVRIGRMIDPSIRNYFITIRKHQVKDFVDVQDLMNILNYIMHKVPSLRLGANSFEIDKVYNQLHFHAIVTTSHYFNFKGLTSHNGFRIYWKPVYSKKLLHHYIQKDAFNKYEQEQIIISNYYNHNYGFV